VEEEEVGMSLFPFAVAWVLLVLAVIVLAFYRGFLTRNVDDVPHVASAASAGAVNRQVAVTKKLESVERLGKLLTIVAVVVGVVLALAYGYTEWVRSSRVAG
jgi:hypothetical protein